MGWGHTGASWGGGGGMHFIGACDGMVQTCVAVLQLFSSGWVPELSEIILTDTLICLSNGSNCCCKTCC